MTNENAEFGTFENDQNSSLFTKIDHGVKRFKTVYLSFWKSKTWFCSYFMRFSNFTCSSALESDKSRVGHKKALPPKLEFPNFTCSLTPKHDNSIKLNIFLPVNLYFHIRKRWIWHISKDSKVVNFHKSRPWCKRF